MTYEEFLQEFGLTEEEFLHLDAGGFFIDMPEYEDIEWETGAYEPSDISDYEDDDYSDIPF